MLKINQNSLRDYFLILFSTLQNIPAVTIETLMIDMVEKREDMITVKEVTVSPTIITELADGPINPRPPP